MMQLGIWLWKNSSWRAVTRQFFLCVNDPCVVIGKHQNPWLECDLNWMAAEGIPLRRRISGGGTVVHDAGNLNVGLILPRSDYCEADAFEVFLVALISLGIPARRRGRSAIIADGKKISGQAFCYRGSRVLHHGTLLLDSDLDRLQRALQPAGWEMETHAVASEPATVGNLNRSREEVEAALRESITAVIGSKGGKRFGVAETEARAGGSL